jgi:hypothetical protein
MRTDPFLEILTTLLLAVHLGLVNVSSAMPLFAVYLQRQSRRCGNRELQHAACRSVATALFALALALVTGLAMAGVMWLTGDRGLFEVLPRFDSKIRWAIWELLFYVACMLGLWALFAQAVIARGWARVLQVLLAVLATTNLVYHFPPLFSIMAQAANQTDLVSLSVSPQEFRQLMMRGYVVPLMVHFALASLTVSGVVIMYQLVSEASADKDSKPSSHVARSCAIVALTATAAQILVGIWLLVRLGPVAQSRLLGSDITGSISLGLSVLATFWLLHLLAAASFAQLTRRDARRIAIWLALLIVLMTVTLRRAEGLARGGAFLLPLRGQTVETVAEGPY